MNDGSPVEQRTVLTREPMRPLTREEFVQQYVLNRALAHTGGLDARSAAESGDRGYDEIKRLCRIGGAK